MASRAPFSYCIIDSLEPLPSRYKTLITATRQHGEAASASAKCLAGNRQVWTVSRIPFFSHRSSVFQLSPACWNPDGFIGRTLCLGGRTHSFLLREFTP